MSEYKFKLNDFEGPLDLLIHLIKEKKKDIMDVDLSELTTQYISFIQEFKEKLDIASEYLVMASYLLEIKSKMLLPKPEVEIEDDFEEDNRQKLLKRLMEYKRFKEVAAMLEEQSSERNKYYIKNAMLDLSEYKVNIVEEPDKIPDNLDIYKLVSSLQKMYKRIALSRPLETKISHKEVSTEEMMDRIEKRLKPGELFNFEDLFEEDFSKHLFVISFLAILVLSRQQRIEIVQIENFGQIAFTLKEAA